MGARRQQKGCEHLYSLQMLIVGNVIGSIFWGAVLAVVVTLAIFVLCRQLNRADSILTWVILAVLLLFAGAQSTMMVGAVYAKGYVDDISSFANSFMPKETNATPNIADFERIRYQIEEAYPLSRTMFEHIDTEDIQSYINSGHTITEFITDQMKSTINYYILRRAAWLLGGVLLALVGILLFNKPHDYTIDINNLESIY